MRSVFAAVAGFAFALSAVPAVAEPDLPASDNSAAARDSIEPQPPEYIGYCWMEADGTIRMFLRIDQQYGDRRIVGHTYPEYRPSDPDYQKILDHVGPMKPGDNRPVPPWP